MIPERWQRVKQLLEEALELPTDQRELFLDNICDSDDLLRQEVESLLLEENANTNELLQSPLYAALTDLDKDRADWVGRQVGSYKITEKIGEGGMGAVYRAARADEQYQKQVAVKIVKQGLDTPFAASRFRAERQILADLEHPNIARLLDGGTTDNGFPYVVMELVEGQPIDQYCAAHSLPVEERLQLFHGVCLAVQYAHQHLIVHRDLKPGNILVTGDGVPKLLDFGIAKILDPELLPCGLEATVSLDRMLTPQYASPEQVRGETITTASDVYSLGVILFLLLTGRLPVQFDQRSPEAIVRAICDTEPPKPSTAVLIQEKNATMSDLRPGKGSLRLAVEGEPLQKLSKRLRGDLDNIALMALRKEPQRRYASAQELAEDIRRHMENLPVIACGDSAAYRVSKFVARHRAAAAAAVIVAIMLIIGMVTILREDRIARTERAHAEQRFNDVRNLSNTLLFQINDSIQDVPGTTQARRLLISSAQRYLDSLSQETSGDLSLLRELATGYERLGQIQRGRRGSDLGDSTSAIDSYRKAVTLREAIAQANPSNPQAQYELQASYDDLGFALLDIDINRSADYLQKSKNIASALVRAHPANADFLEALTRSHEHQAILLIHRNDMSAALECQRKSLELAQQLVDMDPSGSHRITLSYEHKRLGALFIHEQEFPQALKEYKASQALDEESLAANPNDLKSRIATSYTYSDIGFLYNKQGDRGAALASYQKALEIRQDLAHADPNDAQARLGVARTCGSIGMILRDEGRFKAALPYNLRQVAIYSQQVATNPSNPRDRWELADTWWDLGNDYMGLAGKSTATNEKLRLLRLAQSYLQQAQVVYQDPKTQALLIGGDANAPQLVSRDLERCNKKLNAIENLAKP